MKDNILMRGISLNFEEKGNHEIENIDKKKSNSINDQKHKIEYYLDKLCINYQKYFILG